MDAPSEADGLEAPLDLQPRPEGSVRPATLRALHSEEAARASIFGQTVAFLAALALLANFFVQRYGVLWLVATTVLVLMCLIAAWVWRRARQPGRYSRGMFRVFGWTSVLAVIVLIWYWGISSPAPVAVALGLSFFAMGDDRVHSISFAVVCAVAYFSMATLQTLGYLGDEGMIRPGRQPVVMERLFLSVLVPAVFLVGMWMARLNRRATYEAMERLHDAVRLGHKKEAQLAEAQRDLERALRAGAGHSGRYSGQVAGQYRLGEVLAHGAMGEVYAGVHVASGALAAVKLLHADVQEESAHVERFLREAEVTARLKAPHVVIVYEAGRLADGAPFIAMERLAGHDLGWHLRQRRQLPLDEILCLCHEVARGLAAAHEAGVIHRDIKPQNLFWAEPAAEGTPCWKILDFGVSKLAGSRGTLTQHAVVGTPGYMSPEQAQGLDADPQSDVFSLGAVIYRALTGLPPFGGDDTPQILFEIVYKNPARPGSLVPSLPPDVDLVLVIALAKRPGDRFAGAPELAAALRAAAEGRLGAELRARAEELLAAHPWGKRAAIGEVPGAAGEGEEAPTARS